MPMPDSLFHARNPLFVVNPTALGGTGRAVWEAFQRAWAGRVRIERIAVTAYPGHATHIAAEVRGHDVVVAVGGDGTVRELACGLLSRPAPLPLAIVPTGTGNDVARAVGVVTVADSVAALCTGRLHPLDVLQVDCSSGTACVRHYACLTASVGVSATVIHRLKPWMKRCLGARNAYLLATVVAVAQYRCPRMVVCWDGGEYRGRTLLVNVGNAEWESGGGMRMSPGARVDDGMANVCLIRAAPTLRLLRKLPHVLTGDHIHDAEVTYVTATRVEVDSHPPAGLQMDGDALGVTPAAFTVRRHALRVLTPATALAKPRGHAGRPCLSRAASSPHVPRTSR